MAIPQEAAPVLEAPIVGREQERSALSLALRAAQEGRGGVLAVTGPGGIGKSRLLHWAEDEARRSGFEVRWGYCLKESLEPYFAFEQVFRRLAPADAAPKDPVAAFGGAGSAPVLIIEEDRPRRIFEAAQRLGAEVPTMVLSRERAQTLRQRYPGFTPTSTLLYLSRTPGADTVDPSSIDTLGDRLETHLRSHPGSVAALAGIDYLVSQNGFLPTLRLVQMLRDTADETGGHLLLSVHPVALEQRQLSLLEAEGEVARAPPEGGSGREGTRAPAGPETPAQRLLRYIELLSSVSLERPCLLLIDDLQWADPQSLLAFQFVARNLRGLRVLLLASLREEEGEDPVSGVSTTEVLDRLAQEGFAQRLPLRGLGEEESLHLAEAALGGALELRASDAPFLDFLRRTAGNPYFVLETVRGLLADGAARRLASGEIVLDQSGEGRGGAHLPPSIRRMISQRLATLTPEERKFVHVAAVLGSEFDLEAVSKVLGLHRSDGEALARALHERLRMMAPVPEAQGRWSFSHPMTWEAVLSDVASTELRTISGDLCDWLLAHRPTDTAILARLCHSIGDGERGLPFLRRVLSEAVDAQAGETIVRYHAWLQDLLAAARVPVPDRVEEGMSLVGSLWMQGSFRAAHRVLETLEGLRPNRAGLLAIRRSQVDLLIQEDLHKAEEILLAAWKEIGSHPEEVSPVLRARWLISKARLGMEATRVSPIADCEEALKLLGPEGPPDERCRAIYNLVYDAMERNDPKSALPLLNEGLEIARRSNLPLYRADYLSLQSWAESSLGEYRHSLAYMTECVDLYRKNGGVQWLTVALANLTRLLFDLRESEQAFAAAAEALELSRKFDLPRLLSLSLLLNGELRNSTGDWEGARPYLERAREFSTKLGFREHSVSAEMFLASCRGHLGEREEALRLLRSLAEHETDLEPGRKVRLKLLTADMLELLGRSEESHEGFLRALDMARELRNLTLQEEATELLAKWERKHGSATKADELRASAEHMLRVVRGEEPSASGSTLGLTLDGAGPSTSP